MAKHIYLILCLQMYNDMMNDIQYLLGLGCSDHVCLSFKLKCYSLQRSCKPRPKYNLRHANFNRMRELLGNIDWHQYLNPLSTIEAWEYFPMHLMISYINVYP